MTIYDNLTTGRAVCAIFTHKGNGYREEFNLIELRYGSFWDYPLSAQLDPRGTYRWLLECIETGVCVASAGFCSLFGEWQSTADSLKGNIKSFSESICFPEPRQRADLCVQRRDSNGIFRDIFRLRLDPNKLTIKPGPRPLVGFDLSEIMINGPAREKVDILLIADGYTIQEKSIFNSDVKQFQQILFSINPYRDRISDFNIRSLFVPSRESGVSDPSAEIYRETALGASYCTLGIERYLMPSATENLHNAYLYAPCDLVVVLCNSDKYGGGGLFNQYACIAAHSENIEYLTLHELGHAFAGLADEYYTAHVTYEHNANDTAEPWEPNIGRLDPRSHVKWQALIDSTTPVPTPWEKQIYEDIMIRYEAISKIPHSVMDPPQNQKEETIQVAKFHLQKQAYYGKVGAFEGAGYQTNGLYRPEVDCLMFSRTASGFCRVCQIAIIESIEKHIQFNY